MEQSIPGVGLGTAILTSALFFAVAAVFIAFFAFRQRHLSKSLDALRSALDHGSELTPGLANMLEMRSDLRRGVISLARALACILLGITIQLSPLTTAELYTTRELAEASTFSWILIGLSAFPGLFGLALIGFHISGARSKR